MLQAHWQTVSTALYAVIIYLLFRLWPDRVYRCYYILILLYLKNINWPRQRHIASAENTIKILTIYLYMYARPNYIDHVFISIVHIVLYTGII